MSTAPVTVVMRAERGRVEVLAGHRRLSGRLGRGPRRLRLGDEVHVLLQEPGGDAFEGRVALLGRVLSFDGVARRLDLKPGRSFELSVLMLVRGGVSVPLASVFGAQAARAADLGSHEGPELLPLSDDDDLEQSHTISVTGLLAESRLAQGRQMAGSLLDMSLVDLVQSFDLCRKTAVIELHAEADPRAVAEVFVEDGAVVHAYFNDLSGPDAFVELAQLERGSFRVRFGEGARRHTIDVPSAFLVMDALRQIDEGRKVAGEGTETRVAPPPTPLTAMHSGLFGD
jgi:hypothetical protein